MKRSLKFVVPCFLLLISVLAIVLGWQFFMQPTAIHADTTRSITFVNNTTQTVWAGALSNPGLALPENGGWTMAPGSTHTITVASNWAGRFWGRTYCTFDAAGKGRAMIEFSYIGGCRALSETETSARSGPEADARAYLVLRPYLRTAVAVSWMETPME